MVAVAVLVSSGLGAQQRAEPPLPPIPAKDPQAVFSHVPAPWRDHLVQARAAARIDEALQRCLAWPDLPGNQWPARHAEAHCHLHVPIPLALADVEAMLERGEAAELDAHLDGLLAKHFTDALDAEDVHDALLMFGGTGADSERVSARWLALAPGSAWANFARSKHYQGAAADARGGAWASETPPENMRRMSALIGQALVLLREAIRINPRMMPAYADLVRVGRVDSRADVEREAMAGIAAHDPACSSAAIQRMWSLTPRWGGSYEQMLTYAAELSPYLARRPQLAAAMSKPYADRGNRLVAEKQYSAEAAEVLAVAVRTGSDEMAMRDAADVAFQRTADPANRWMGLALLLQEDRFKPTTAWGHRMLAWYLMPPEPEWALRHARKAVALDPEQSFGQYVLGVAYLQVGEFAWAEHYLLKAYEDPQRRQEAGLELVITWFAASGESDAVGTARKAKPYIDQLLAANPANAIAWILRLEQESIMDGRFSDASARQFLRHADRSDPRQAERAAEVETVMRERGVPLTP